MITISEHIGFRVLQDIKCISEGLNQLIFRKRFGFSKIKYYLYSGKGERKGLDYPSYGIPNPSLLFRKFHFIL